MAWVLFWLICAGVCAWVAKEKNRDSLGWFFLGLLLGPIGLIALAAVPSLPKQQ